jgi:hypothetical protein
VNERKKMLKMNVNEKFMMVDLDEGKGNKIKYKYKELKKIKKVV